jgi:hypothetical protein
MATEGEWTAAVDRLGWLKRLERTARCKQVGPGAKELGRSRTFKCQRPAGRGGGAVGFLVS